MFRIQKLLVAEFRDINEPVLVENPFTQVDEEGNGIRQYHIGLTASKLLFGSDDFEDVSLSNIRYRQEVDPETETFKLVSLVPLQFIKLDFYRRDQRELMKMTLHGEENKPLYFEFGGHTYRILFRKVWRDRVSNIHLVQSDLFRITRASSLSTTTEDEVSQAFVYNEPNSISRSEISWHALLNN